MTFLHERRRGVLLLLLAASLAVASPAAGAQDLRWGGEWQAGGTASVRDAATDVTLSGLLRLQAQMLSDDWRLTFEGHGGLNGPLTGEGEWLSQGEVDRLFLRLYLPAADVTLGKQAITWGVGTAWSPTDLFSPPDADDPSATRPGVVAASVQIPMGPLASWSLAAADGIYGVRRRGYFRGTDWALVAASEDGDVVVGADAKGDWGIGWHAAATYRMPGDGGDPSLDGLIGADYSWLGGDLAWLGEYHVQVPLRPEAAAKHETYQQLTYRVDDFTSLFGSVKANLDGGGAAWSAGAATLLGAQSELAASVTFPPPAASVGRSGESPGAVVAVQLSQAF